MSDGTTTASTLSFDASNWWIPQIVTVAAVNIIDPNSPLLHPGTKQFAVQPHLLSDIKGPLEIEGGTGGAVHPLIAGVVLPGETNPTVFPIAVQPPEGQSIDILNVFDDSSQEDKQGVLTGTQLTGLGLSAGLRFDQAALGENADFAAGITYGKDGKSNIEVFNLLMGSGNDSLTIDSTLQTTAAHGGLTHHPRRRQPGGSGASGRRLHRHDRRRPHHRDRRRRTHLAPGDLRRHLPRRLLVRWPSL